MATDFDHNTVSSFDPTPHVDCVIMSHYRQFHITSDIQYSPFGPWNIFEKNIFYQWKNGDLRHVGVTNAADLLKNWQYFLKSDYRGFSTAEEWIAYIRNIDADAGNLVEGMINDFWVGPGYGWPVGADEHPVSWKLVKQIAIILNAIEFNTLGPAWSGKHVNDTPITVEVWGQTDFQEPHIKLVTLEKNDTFDNWDWPGYFNYSIKRPKIIVHDL